MNKKKPTENSTRGRRAAPRTRRVAGEKPPAETARRRKKTPKRRKRTAKPAKQLSLNELLPNTLGRSTTEASGVVLAVFQKGEGKVQQHLATLDRPVAASERLRLKEGTKILKQPAAAARLLHGAAHAERLRLMAELIPGPRTHHDLKTATGLKAGPLYHHVRELERADLVVCPARNRYELTEAGRLTFLLTAGLVVLSSNGRRAAPWRAQRGARRP